MTVKYEENEQGIFWVEGDHTGEPQKDLHHAMKDYELVSSGRKNNASTEGISVRTGSEEANANGAQEEARSAGASGGSSDDPDPRLGDPGSEGTDDPQV